MAFSMKLPAAKKPPQASSGGVSGAKQYGLILPTKKDAKKELTPASVFSAAAHVDDTRTNTTDEKAAERRRVGAEAARSLQRAKVESTHEKALAEDATVFDYDGVYDEIQSSRDSKKRERKAQRESEKQSSKYISTLLEKAKVREIEHERIRERRLLKERATEDALYGDKEKLVSASYKRKLQDMKRWDEEDKRMDEMEAAEDVTKRAGDAMAGFYSNLLTKNLAMGGAAANARSAYTVGRGDNTKESRHEQQARRDAREHEREHERDATSSSHPETIASGDELSTAKKPRVDGNKDASTEQVERSQKLVTAAPPPTATKEETISAARARFLARKAARQQQERLADSTV